MDLYPDMIPAADAPEEEREAFVIDSDELAEWALRKISEADAERQRLTVLVSKEEYRLKDAREKIERDYHNATDFLTAKLEDYFNTVPHRKTKTQQSYQLLSGKLIRKTGQPKCVYDDAALTAFLETNYPDMIAVTKKPQWGTFKRLLAVDAASGIAIVQETGEIVDCITVHPGEETFSIKF